MKKRMTGTNAPVTHTTRNYNIRLLPQSRIERRRCVFGALAVFAALLAMTYAAILIAAALAGVIA